jgi:2-polyprenyl-3-methyl-5-hydroxy-6-metoxy-1,4-benzoquinol methylase
MGIGARYLTSDVERTHPHDYSDFLAVQDRFDAIVMLELLEHLQLDTGLRFFQHAVDLLEPGGVLVIGTPNAHHPHQVWSADLTHVRPWPAHDLWALCVVAGLQGIEVYRQTLTSRRRRFLIPVQVALGRLMGFDTAYGLLLFAHKPR